MKYIPMILVLLGIVAIILIPQTKDTVIEKGALMKEISITHAQTESSVLTFPATRTKVPTLDELDEKYSKMDTSELKKELSHLSSNKVEQILIEKANKGTLTVDEEEQLLSIIRTKIVVSTKLLEAQLEESEVL